MNNKLSSENMEQGAAQSQTKRLAADKSKKSRISGIIAACSIAVVAVSIMLNEMLGSSVVFGVFAGIGFIVALFSSVACIGYMRDIPISDRTKGQRVFFVIITVIGVILAIFMIWYRFLGGQDVIINAMLGSAGN